MLPCPDQVPRIRGLGLQEEHGGRHGQGRGEEGGGGGEGEEGREGELKEENDFEARSSD